MTKALLVALMVSFATPALADRCFGPYDSAKDFWYDQKLCR